MNHLTRTCKSTLRKVKSNASHGTPGISIHFLKAKPFLFFGTRRRALGHFLALCQETARENERLKEGGTLKPCREGFGTTTLQSSIALQKNISTRTAMECTFPNVPSASFWQKQPQRTAVLLQDRHLGACPKRNVDQNESNRLARVGTRAMVGQYSAAGPNYHLEKEEASKQLLAARKQHASSTGDSSGKECTPETYVHRIIFMCMTHELAVTDKPH